MHRGNIRLPRWLVVLAVVGLMMAAMAPAAMADKPTGFDSNGKALGLVKDTGFDQYGYNYQARIFSGPADGSDRNLDGTVWGDPTYANDLLVMKWSKAWDDARFNGAEWTPDAWVTNEWNGMMPDGSGETWHNKIIWVGADLEDSEYWVEGGYPIWGQFEMIMSQGTVDGVHMWDALATPNGLGG